MKRLLLMIMFAVQMMPYITDMPAYGDTDVIKIKLDPVSPDKNIGKTDPVTFGFEELSKTISIGFNKDAASVDVCIYKDGALIYKERDSAVAQTKVNYEICDAEGGNYTVIVATDGQLQVDETVTIDGDDNN